MIDGDVKLDRLIADREAAGDAAIGQPERDQVQDFELARRQVLGRWRIVLGRLADAIRRGDHDGVGNGMRVARLIE